MGVVGLIVVYGLLLTAVVAVIVCAGTLLVYIGETVRDRVIEPWQEREARAHRALVDRIPRRDLRHLPH